jgi:hypothetical protein
MKTQAIEPAMRAVLDVIAGKQFADMQRNRPYYDALINNTPSGKETQFYNVGDTVISTGTGTYKKGFQMIIIEAYEENGYFKYVCGHGKKNKAGEYKFKHVERQKDLRKG